MRMCMRLRLILSECGIFFLRQVVARLRQNRLCRDRDGRVIIFNTLQNLTNF